MVVFAELAEGVAGQGPVVLAHELGPEESVEERRGRCSLHGRLRRKQAGRVLRFEREPFETDTPPRHIVTEVRTTT